MRINKKLFVIFIGSMLIITGLTGCRGKKKRKNPVAPGTQTYTVDTTDEKDFSLWEKNTKIRAAITSQDYSTAVSLATERILANPTDDKAHFLLGQAFMGKNSFERARQSFENAIKLSPDNQNYIQELNSCLSKMLDIAIDNDIPSEAIEIGRQLFKKGYNQAQTEEKLAHAYIMTFKKLIDSGNDEEAETVLREAVSEIPEQIQVKVELGLMLMSQDRLMESERLLNKLISNNPEHINSLLAYATLLHKMGESRKAETIIDKILQLAPDNMQAANLRSEISPKQAINIDDNYLNSLYGLKKLKELLTVAEKIDSLPEQKKIMEAITLKHPEEVEILLKLSRINERMGFLEEAMSKVEQYIVQIPDSLPGKLQLVRCLYQLGNTERASELINEIESSYPDKLEIAIEKGQILARTGKFDEAKILWNKILEVEKDHPDTLFNFAQLEMESGNANLAQEYFERAIQKDPFNHKYRYFAGLNLFQSGLQNQAYSVWNATQSSLNSGDPYAARILKALNESQPIQNTNNKLNITPPSLSLIPTAPDTPIIQIPTDKIKQEESDKNYNIALNYARNGYFDEAIAAFKDVLIKNPSNFNALMNLGKVYTAKGNGEKACILYLKALQLDPQNIFALRSLANSYSKVGMHSLAAQITDQVRNKQPEKLEGFPRYNHADIKNNPRAFEPLAKTMIQENLLPQAMALIQSGFDQQLDSTILYLLQGDIHKQQGQYEAALNSYNIAVAKDPQNPATYMRIGDLYVSSAQTSAAASEYHKALKSGFIDPDSMIEVSDRFKSIGRGGDSKRVLNHLKTMNLNQAQIKKLSERLEVDLTLDIKEKNN